MRNKWHLVKVQAESFNSSEWSHHRISSIDSKVRVTSQNPLKHAGSERVKIVGQMIRSEEPTEREEVSIEM